MLRSLVIGLEIESLAIIVSWYRWLRRGKMTAIPLQFRRLLRFRTLIHSLPLFFLFLRVKGSRLSAQTVSTFPREIRGIIMSKFDFPPSYLRIRGIKLEACGSGCWLPGAPRSALFPTSVHEPLRDWLCISRIPPARSGHARIPLHPAGKVESKMLPAASPLLIVLLYSFHRASITVSFMPLLNFFFFFKFFEGIYSVRFSVLSRHVGNEFMNWFRWKLKRRWKCN